MQWVFCIFSLTLDFSGQRGDPIDAPSANNMAKATPNPCSPGTCCLDPYLGCPRDAYPNAPSSAAGWGHEGPLLLLKAPGAPLGVTAALREVFHGAGKVVLPSPSPSWEGTGGHPRHSLKFGLPLHQGSAGYGTISHRANLKDAARNHPGTCPRV